MAWGMARLAQIEPGAVVLDPMVGKAGTLLQAASLQPDATYIGIDTDEEQIEAARHNVASRLGGAPIELLVGDGTSLPHGRNTVDRVLCDLPFGKKHGTAVHNTILYPR